MSTLQNHHSSSPSDLAPEASKTSDTADTAEPSNTHLRARISAPHESSRDSSENTRGDVVETPDARFVTPALVGALVYLVCGAFTIFWQQPTEFGLTVFTGLLLLSLGLSQAMLSRPMKSLDSAAGKSLESLAMVLGAAAVLLGILTPHNVLFTVITCLVLGAVGIFKILLGMRLKDRLLIAKDWQIEGLVLTFTSLALVITSDIGTKAITGTLGGGAIIAGVFLLLGALGMRSKSSRADS